jgi:1-acyl-sn-glycerol-3-phosphate acyltransferase
MNLWVPPRWVRRVAHVLWVPMVLLFTVILVPVFIVAAVLALIPGRHRLVRVVAFAVCYLWTDVAMLVGCWVLWLRQPLPSRDETLWLERHSALLARALKMLAVTSRKILGFRVVIDACASPAPTRPLLVLARHAGPGDSLALVNLLLRSWNRRPKVILKEALQWDPGIDILLNRLNCYFLPSGTGAGDDRLEAVRRLALSLTENEALLIFPEGGNWTPKRHARAVRYLLRRGEHKRAAEAAEQERVQPPRPGGVIATLSARPDLDVVVIAHAGLDRLVSPADIWGAVPADHQPMAVHWWITPAADVPREDAAIVTWVDDVWSDVDEWIEGEHDEAAVVVSPLVDVPPLAPAPAAETDAS